jgi:hypothetical protein
MTYDLSACVAPNNHSGPRGAACVNATRFAGAAMLVLPALGCGLGLGGAAPVANTEAGVMSYTEGGSSGDGMASSTESDGSAFEASLSDAAPISLGDAAPISFGDATFVSGSPCKAGDYTGTFTCLFQILDSTAEAGSQSSFINSMVTGPVTLTLNQSSSGNLTVAGGSVSGTAVGSAIMFSAMMQGQLDCATGQFIGELVNGMYMGTGPLGGFTTGSFQVSFSAAYDNKNYAFVNGVTGGGCIGNQPSEGWSATYCGPAGSCGPG